ncbi:MAG TPA: hypothetical protein VGH84_01665 [Steroidobacteraceae bacterium]|jgi:hypothetical protein
MTTAPAKWMTADAIALARTLWDEGLSCSAIAWRVGTTKSCIVGFAHRRGFPPRPSPIGRRKGEVREAQPRAPDAPRVACRPQPLAVPTPAFGSCQWISGGDDRRRWTMCGEPTANGSSYCDWHHRQAHSPIPRRAA